MGQKAAEQLRQRLNATGIGFAGLDGLWWLPATEPYQVSENISYQLGKIGPAIFHFFDVIIDLYRRGTSSRLIKLLEYKVPDEFPHLVCNSHLACIRPDFQLSISNNGSRSFQLKITELEVCPSAQGFSTAMQIAYGLPIDIVTSFADFLDGRNFLIIGTQAWSEFLFEQLAFCRALEDTGIKAHVLYDLPISTIANQVRLGKRWQPPIFGIPTKPDNWDDNVHERIHRHGLDSYIWPNDQSWPTTIEDSAVFRFGYLDNFSTASLEHMVFWEQKGAKLINPPTFFLENKVVMAALNLFEVRQRLDPAMLAVLDACIPETILLKGNTLSRLVAEREDWVIKYAAYDGGDQAWGGRSLAIGLNHTRTSWVKVLDRYLACPWPVVAQRLTPSAKVNIHYYDQENQERLLSAGNSRLRAFFLRRKARDIRQRPKTRTCGTHITVTTNSVKVSEGLAAVQAPVVFAQEI